MGRKYGVRRRGRWTYQPWFLKCVIEMQNISKFESGSKVLLTLFKPQTIFLKHQFHAGPLCKRVTAENCLCNFLVTQVHFLLVASIIGHKLFELLISAYSVLNKFMHFPVDFLCLQLSASFFKSSFEVWTFIMQLMVGIVNWRLWQMRHHKV